MARKENIRYIVMYHSKPILEVNPVNDDELSIEHFAEEIKTARKQVKNKEVYSQDKIMKEFGMNWNELGSFLHKKSTYWS